jgi:hypothetical protein
MLEPPSLSTSARVLRNQVEKHLGPCVMSDWPDGLKLCVCSVELCCVCFILCIYLIVYVVCCQYTREEWLTTLCGLTLGLVLQVLVAAWFALVQVKNRRERS